MEEGAWRIKEVGKVVVEGGTRGKTKDTREQRERERERRARTHAFKYTYVPTRLFILRGCATDSGRGTGQGKPPSSGLQKSVQRGLGVSRFNHPLIY